VSAFNYFNYFTEIEEYFWRKRGAHMLVSPLDWAILECWQKASIPVETVLKGIDQAFESYGRSRRGSSGRPLKSLAYCVDAVLDAAEEAREAAAGSGPEATASSPRKSPGEQFSREEVAGYLARNAQKLRERADDLGQKGHTESRGLAIADFVRRLVECVAQLDAIRLRMNPQEPLDLEDLERHLTVLEDAFYAGLQACADAEIMLEIRREMDRQLAPYRRKMTAAQLALLEQQYHRRRLLETYGLPRLSLFYLA
jgi:hypothetical protein